MLVVFICRRVYWIDAHLDHLEFCNYDGNNRHLVLSGSGNIKHPFALTLFEDWVYWTDWHGKKVYKTHKTQGGELKSLFRGIMKPMDIHVVHPLRQPKGTVLHGIYLFKKSQNYQSVKIYIFL